MFRLRTKTSDCVGRRSALHRFGVALVWTHQSVVSPVIGVRTLAQAEDNLKALDLVLRPEQLDRLNRISAPSPIFPARFTQRPLVQQLIFGGAAIKRRR